MTTLHLLVLTLLGLVPRQRDDRGDVPGWVLVTVMSAGLVAVLAVVAEDELSRLLTQALRQVQ